MLKPTGPETYIVIEGDMEYYAAVKAREKDPRKGEMVNAFVISPKVEEAIQRQLQTFQGSALSSSPSDNIVKPDESPHVQKDTDAISFETLQSLQNEVENINRKIEILSSLPSQVTGMIQLMERNFKNSFNEISSLPSQVTEIIQQMEINFKDSLNTRLTEWENKKSLELAKESKPPVVISTGIYDNKTVKELKALAKERKIRDRSKLTKKAELIEALEKDDMT